MRCPPSRYSVKMSSGSRSTVVISHRPSGHTVHPACDTQTPPAVSQGRDTIPPCAALVGLQPRELLGLLQFMPQLVCYPTRPANVLRSLARGVAPEQDAAILLLNWQAMVNALIVAPP